MAVVLVVIAVVLAVLAYFFLRGGKSKAFPTVYIVGPVGAGKTTLFHLLMGRPDVTTRMSTLVNEGLCRLPGDERPSFSVVDFPGSERQRRFLRERLSQRPLPAAIVFVFDAVVGPLADLPSSASFLAEVLRLARGVPVCVAVNKCDSRAAHSVEQAFDVLNAATEAAIADAANAVDSISIASLQKSAASVAPTAAAVAPVPREQYLRTSVTAGDVTPLLDFVRSALRG